MPKIKTSSGFVSFKPKIIYSGIHQLNKEIAAENLQILKKVLDSHGVQFFLAYGTLLGAVREKDFIEYDEDIDLNVKAEYKQALFDALPDLIDKGFEIARYDRRELLSIIRKNEYIDFYFFKTYRDGLRYCSGVLCPDEFFEEVSYIEFKGQYYLIPKNYQDFLMFEYGDNWMTPIKYKNYELPKKKKMKLMFRQWVKTLVPDFLFFYLADKTAAKEEAKYKTKVHRYRLAKLNNL